MAKWSWKYHWVNVTLTGTELAETDSDQQIISHLESEMQGASMTMNDMLSTAFFGNGTGNSSKDFEGLLNALDYTNFTTYGGIDRSANTWWNAYNNTTGGAITLDMINAAIGQCTFDDKLPDMGITTQTLYDKIWARVQPQQRFIQGGGKNSDLFKVGATGIEFNNHFVIIVDNHCPAGYFFGLNTDRWKVVINKNKNFQWTEPKTPVNADMYVRQLLLGGNFLCIEPRANFMLTGLT